MSQLRRMICTGVAVFLTLFLTFPVPSSPQFVFVQVSTEGCSVTKKCWRYPSDCDTADDSCEIMLTWASSDTPGFVNFELLAKTDGWVAFGLSTDTQMGNDSVTHCVKTAEGTPDVRLSYNVYSQILDNVELPSAYAQNLMKNMSGAYIDDFVHCRFQRSVASNETRVYQLDASYYLFLGYGPIDSAGTMIRHRKDPHVSLQTIDLTDTNDAPAAKPSEFSANGNLVKYYKDGTNDVHLELTGAPSKQWVAIAFSKDQSMGDDSVVSCSLDSPSGTVIVARHSFNDGRTHVPVDNAENGITLISSSVENGVIKCVLKKTATGLGNPKIFDLDTEYYLFLGSGSVDSNGNLQQHVIRPGISADKVNVMEVTNGENIDEEEEDLSLLRAHGTLMITAWVLLASPAILLARYFKADWPSKKICTIAIWFAVHQVFQLLALFCTIAGFVIVFVHVGLPDPKTINDEYKGHDEYPTYYSAHAPIGIVVMILVIINPSIAAFRCKPNSEYRPIFNWAHWAIGTICHILALINVFFGVKMGENNPEKADRFCHIAIFWILIAFVSVHVVVELLLVIFYECGGDKHMVSKAYELRAPGSSIEKPNQKQKRGVRIFRYVLLAIYGVIVLALWLAMIILIGSGTM